MPQADKLLRKAKNSPQNLRFTELIQLAEAFGYRLDNVEGSHRVMRHPNASRLSLQPLKDGKAKTYQVDQLLKAITKYNLKMED